ncbi:MAG: methylenetetrahydrofolate reductase C-terminal domain-containing protein [Thermodesulfobacteriota bacterium]
MIVGDLKPIHELIPVLSQHNHVLILGCGSCVTVCLSGGEREARLLAAELSQIRHYPEDPPEFTAGSILRQCELDLVSAYQEIGPHTDAILSLACGAGVQTMADAFEPLPVYPALNTTFLGASLKPGVWNEMCRGCGDCVLTYTGGICPVARCAKSLFNGPCGGSQNGACEVDAHTPCAWALIYFRLKKQNRLHLMNELRLPKNWQPEGGSGPRTRIRTGIA